MLYVCYMFHLLRVQPSEVCSEGGRSMTVDADSFLFDVDRDDTGIVFEEVRGRTRKLLVNLKSLILDSDGDCCAREANSV